MTAKSIPPEPIDGTAVILHLIEACREVTSRTGLELDGQDVREIVKWTRALEARYEREQPEPEPVTWHPRTWGEVIEGDMVQLHGVKALVKASTLLNWHVDPNSSEYRPVAMERAEVRVTLLWNGNERTYGFPPRGEIEVKRGPAGQAVDEANGFRAGAGDEPVNVLHSWAEDAAATLNAAGLGPVEVIR